MRLRKFRFLENQRTAQRLEYEYDKLAQQDEQSDERPEKIPILEYHNLGEIDSRWTRSYELFRSDLEWLYNNDFRAVTIGQYMNLDFEDLEEGMRPVVITFDDASMDYTYEDLDGQSTVITQVVNIAMQKGILVVTSAGNSGNDSWKYITAPADAPGILSVGGRRQGAGFRLI